MDILSSMYGHFTSKQETAQGSAACLRGPGRSVTVPVFLLPVFFRPALRAGQGFPEQVTEEPQQAGDRENQYAEEQRASPTGRRTKWKRLLYLIVWFLRFLWLVSFPDLRIEDRLGSFRAFALDGRIASFPAGIQGRR